MVTPELIQFVRNAYRQQNYAVIEETINNLAPKSSDLVIKLHEIALRLFEGVGPCSFYEKRSWIECSYLLLKHYADKENKITKTAINAHILAMGGLGYDTHSVKNIIIDLVLKNNIHFKSITWQPFLRLKEGMLYVLIDSRWHSLEHLAHKREGQVFTWYCSHSGKMLFKTNLSYKLDRQYTIHPNRGITSTDNQVKAYSYQTQICNQPSIIIGTILGRNDAYSLLSGAHSFVGLLNNKGQVKTYGIHQKIEGGCALLGENRFSISSPDWQGGLSKLDHSFKFTRIKVNSMTYKRVQGLLDRLIKNGFKGSLLKKNCTFVVKQVLENANIELPDTKINLVKHVFNCVIKNLFGKAWGEGFVSLVDQVYAWLKYIGLDTLIYFFPPIYIAHIFIGLIIKLFSIGSDSIMAISLLDLIIAPWELSLNHPSIMRLWQNKIEREGLGEKLVLKNGSIPKII